MRRSIAWCGSILLVLALVGATVGWSPASGAQRQAAEPGATRLRLAAQSAWVAPDGTFDLRVLVSEPPPGARIAVQLFRAVGSRTAYGDSIEGDNLGSALRPSPAALPLELLPRAADGSFALSFPVTTATPGPLDIRVDGQGVYPVQVRLLDEADEELDRFTTHLVRLPGPDSTADPLAFSLVVPFAAAPGFTPDGRSELPDAATQRLTAAASALTRHPTVPLVLDPVPETVEATYSSDDVGGALVASLARALGTRQVSGGSYVRLDLGSWVDSSDPAALDELALQTRSGSDVLAALLGVRPDRRTMVVDRSFTPEALSYLNETGVDQLVVPEDQLGPLSGPAAQVTFTQRFEVLNSEGRPMRAVMADAALAARLSATDDPVLNAHLVLADLAVLFFDRPNLARGAVLVVPPDLDVPVATYDALLNGLAGARLDGDGTGARPVVVPTTLDQLFDVTSSATGNRGSTLVRPYQSDAPIPLGSLVESVQVTRARIGSFAGMVGTGLGASRIPALDRQVLIAESAGLDGDTRQSYLNGVGTAIDTQLAGVVTAQEQRVTLTDRSGDIPLTIENRLDYPVDVRVELTSAKLEFPDGSTRTVTLPPGTPTQVDVAVSSKASGAFPLDVRVESPDGTLLIGSTRYTVRSTAISGVGLFLSIGAGAFLLLWWARHWRGIRRARRLVSSASHPTMRPAPLDDDRGAPTPTAR